MQLSVSIHNIQFAVMYILSKYNQKDLLDKIYQWNNWQIFWIVKFASQRGG